KYILQCYGLIKDADLPDWIAERPKTCPEDNESPWDDEPHVLLPSRGVGVVVPLPPEVVQLVEYYEARAVTAIRFKQSGKKYRMTPAILDRIGLGSNGANGNGNGSNGLTK